MEGGGERKGSTGRRGKASDVPPPQLLSPHPPGSVVMVYKVLDVSGGGGSESHPRNCTLRPAPPPPQKKSGGSSVENNEPPVRKGGWPGDPCVPTPSLGHFSDTPHSCLLSLGHWEDLETQYPHGCSLNTVCEVSQDSKVQTKKMNRPPWGSNP